MFMLAQDTQPLLERATMAGQLALVVLVIVGLALWLLGRKLARPACALSGLLIGGFAALAASQALGERTKLLIWVILGCIVGATLAWLLFRVWMAISLSLLLSLAIPLGIIYYQSPDTLQIQAPSAEEAEPWSNPTQTALHSDSINRLQDDIAERYGQCRDRSAAWWEELPGSQRQTLAVAWGGGALVGLVLGAAAPYIAASLASALLGGTLVLVCSWKFMAWLDTLPPWMPTHPAVHLIAVGLITALGMLVQWTIFRSAADK